MFRPGTSGNANAIGGGEIWITAYAETTFHKIIQANEHRVFGAGPSRYEAVSGFMWKNTAAITDIVLTAGGTAYVDGTTATLYGLG